MNNSRRPKVVDFLRRLISLNWKMLATAIWWDFQSELYRREFDLVDDAIDEVLHGSADQAESLYLGGRKALDQVARATGENHPKVIAMSAQLTRARAYAKATKS